MQSNTCADELRMRKFSGEASGTSSEYTTERGLEKFTDSHKKHQKWSAKVPKNMFPLLSAVAALRLIPILPQRYEHKL